MKNNGMNIATKFRARDFEIQVISGESKKTDIKLKPTAEIKIAIIPLTFDSRLIASFIKITVYIVA